MIKFYSSLIVLCLALSACGGGGGDGGNTPPPPNNPPSTPTNFTLSVVNGNFGSISVNQNNTTETCAAGESCDYTLAEGTTITLTATPVAGYALQSWSGACTGNSTCNITLTGNITTSTSYQQLFGADIACTETTPAPPIPNISWQSFTTGLTNPTGIASTTDNSGRLFLTEEAGHVRTVTNGSLDTALFLDITDRVWVTDTTPADLEELSGLLSMAMHPQFESNGLFYVYYISGTGATSNQCATVSPTQCAVISEFNIADINASGIASSERKLLDIPLNTARRISGHLAFGSESTPLLYISTGDGGGNGFGSLADDLSSLNGKLLRIDINNKDMGLEYAIPSSNPSMYADTFSNSFSATGEDEIYAFGFADPMQFSFDVLNGNLLLGDTNEVNIVNSGLHYGWGVCLGGGALDTAECEDFDGSSFVPPMGSGLEYYQTQPIEFKSPISQWESLIGGIVYRGNDYNDLCGTYIYGDFDSGNIAGLRYDGTTASGQEDLTSLAGVTAFGFDQDLEIYALVRASGTLYKLTVP